MIDKVLIAQASVGNIITCGKEYTVEEETELTYLFTGDHGGKLEAPKTGILLKLKTP